VVSLADASELPTESCWCCLQRWDGCAAPQLSVNWTMLCCTVSEEVGLPSMRGHLLDQDKHKESGT